MDPFSRAAWSLMAALGAATLVYPIAPVSVGARSVWYDAVAVLAVLVAFGGVARHRPVRRTGWLLLLGGFAGRVLGDVAFSIEHHVLHLEAYPTPSDAVYVASYAVLTWGAVVMVRSRRTADDLNVQLDGLVVALGAAVLVAVFLVAALADDSSLTLLGTVTSSPYPIADVLLLGVLVRLGAGGRIRTASFRLLLGALGATLAADTAWNITMVVSGDTTSALWNDVLWLVGYLLVGAAAWTPSMRTLAEPGPDPEETAVSRLRVMLLGGGLALPAVALLLDGMGGGQVLWPVVGLGSLGLSVLVLARMAGLLRVVQVQAVRLAALARSDALTGTPNRRTWDLELSRACTSSLDSDTPLCVAILDLDHFTANNDTHGHRAGDLVRREAVPSWTERLRADAFLARYGGEEFAILLPGHTTAEARAKLEALRGVTPPGRTFSAGVALWDPATDLGVAVARAGSALYDAKRSGGDRVVVADRDETTLPSPQIALQTIVDMHTGEEVAVEALSRFPGESPAAVFEAARRDGTGPALEAAAIAAALEHRSGDRLLSINVSLPALLTAEVAAVLPQDLSGIIVEITEYADVEDGPALHARVADLRRRGAQIAVDDWGTGFSNLDRVLRLRPEVVKIDISLIQHLGSSYFRAAVRAITLWADEVGAVICAEGIETEEQWQAAQALGVHTGQGFYFGHPTVPTADALVH